MLRLLCQKSMEACHLKKLLLVKGDDALYETWRKIWGQEEYQKNKKKF